MAGERPLLALKLVSLLLGQCSLFYEPNLHFVFKALVTRFAPIWCHLHAFSFWGAHLISDPKPLVRRKYPFVWASGGTSKWSVDNAPFLICAYLQCRSDCRSRYVPPGYSLCHLMLNVVLYNAPNKTDLPPDSNRTAAELVMPEPPAFEVRCPTPLQWRFHNRSK